MSITYAQKNKNAVQTKRESSVSIIDSSSQSESLQRKADMANNAAQRAEVPRPNNTGMPDNLKAGIESLSGFSMDNVRVHYNSSKPATVQALAYTQGTDIHVAPGQEKHLPHEAWHVAQQMAGRVSPTTNINGMPVNDNAALEHEADVMGEKAVQCKKEEVRCKGSIERNPIGNVFQLLRVSCLIGADIIESVDIASLRNLCRFLNRYNGLGYLIQLGTVVNSPSNWINIIQSKFYHEVDRFAYVIDLSGCNSLDDIPEELILTEIVQPHVDLGVFPGICRNIRVMRWVALNYKDPDHATHDKPVDIEGFNQSVFHHTIPIANVSIWWIVDNDKMFVVALGHHVRSARGNLDYSFDYYAAGMHSSVDLRRL